MISWPPGLPVFFTSDSVTIVTPYSSSNWLFPSPSSFTFKYFFRSLVPTVHMKTHSLFPSDYMKTTDPRTGYFYNLTLSTHIEQDDTL